MKKFDFKSTLEDFEKTLSRLEEKIKYDQSLNYWKRNTNRVIILNYFQVSLSYYKSLILICEYNSNLSITSPVITRAILEIFFTIIYLFDDLDNKVFSFAKIIHRERKREIKQMKELGYSTVEDENFNKRWEDDITSSYSDLLPQNYNWLENNEQFPSPTKILNSFLDSSSEHSFLKFLINRHYRVLSIDAHTEPWRIAQLTRLLNKVDEETIADLKNEQLWFGFVFILAIASEIELNLKYGFEEELSNFWLLFTKLCNPAKEIYEKRYKELFNLNESLSG